MNAIEEALGTIRGENEDWTDVFARVNSERGLDLKTVTKVVISILETLDDQEENRPVPIPEPVIEDEPEPVKRERLPGPPKDVPVRDGGTKGPVKAGNGDKRSDTTTA